jgi:hypothetical protein
VIIGVRQLGGFMLSSWYSSNAPWGVRILSDFEILVGLGYILLGTFLLLYIAISGVGIIALGLILIYMGWALNKLEIWAWWGSILINAAICAGNIIFGGDYLHIILSVVILVYLLTPGIRSRFFQ